MHRIWKHRKVKFHIFRVGDQTFITADHTVRYSSYKEFRELMQKELDDVRPSLSHDTTRDGR